MKEYKKNLLIRSLIKKSPNIYECEMTEEEYTYLVDIGGIPIPADFNRAKHHPDTKDWKSIKIIENTKIHDLVKNRG